MLIAREVEDREDEWGRHERVPLPAMSSAHRPRSALGFRPPRLVSLQSSFPKADTDHNARRIHGK